MNRVLVWLLSSACGMAAVAAAPTAARKPPLADRAWTESRTAHFNLYSCGPSSEVYRVAARLEQFREAYTLLAGAKSVESPPIVVMAFPDHESMKPFLPLADGRPGNLAAFFKRGSDENLIVLSLPPPNAAFTGMEVIFHEYTHLLLRHNARIWPLWLNEGMAEVYSTFRANGHTAAIGLPMYHHLQLLAREPLMPVQHLFAVTHDSPEYNERAAQGIFYAESWLLTHFLMAGDNPVFKARFGQFTRLLRAGQEQEQAFTNALGASLPVIDAQLERYLKRGVFTPIPLALPTNLVSPKLAGTRVLTPVEVRFRLGRELLAIERLKAAQSYFDQAHKLAPASPLPYEGLGLLAAERDEHATALRNLEKARALGSTSFLTHYAYAREKYRLTADPKGRHSPLDKSAAAEIRGELNQSVALMPEFGPAHELLGFFEMVQGDDLTAAEQHLQRAIQLEPDNASYLLTLAQLQLAKHDPQSARRTLGPLLLPNADPRVRKPAEAMLQTITAAH